MLFTATVSEELSLLRKRKGVALFSGWAVRAFIRAAQAQELLPPVPGGGCIAWFCQPQKASGVPVHIHPHLHIYLFSLNKQAKTLLRTKLLYFQVISKRIS